MTTIAQLFQNITPYILDKISSNLKNWHYFHLSPASLIVNPLNLHQSILQPLAKNIDKFYFTILEEIFDKMDQDFFNSEDRKRHYRSKGKKPRTIITMFGKFTYTRHSYQLKTSGSHFYFIDTAFGIEKYQRFEKAVLLEIYRQIGSEISFSKIGKSLGNIIYRNQLISERHKSISRQTIHHLFKKLDATQIKTNDEIHTVDTLFIEADEHYVATQNKQGKVMIKAAQIYTKNHEEKKCPPIYFLDNGQPFWESLIHFLQSKYDLDTIKRVHIIGDGALWIRNGVNYFDRGQARFSLDHFHYMQSLYTFFGKKDKAFADISKSYLLQKNKKAFIEMITTYFNSEQKQTLSFEKNYKYLKNNYTNIQRSFKNKTTCSMENAISHVIASICTSRPKGFKKEYLYKRMQLRMLYLNTKTEQAFYNSFNTTNHTQPAYRTLFSTLERMKKPDTYKVNISIY